MRNVTLGTLAIVAFIGGAVARISSASAATYLHVGADSSGGPGTDPNPIASASQFFVANINGKTINSPIDLYFAVPDYGSVPMAPTISSIKYNGSTNITFSSVKDLGLFTGSGKIKDLYTFVGCTQCDNSLNIPNLTSGLTAYGLAVPSKGYEVFEYVANTGFNTSGKPYLEVTGNFGLGTYIAPLGFNGSKIYDTSFTNTGLITASAPETSTWGMMLLGFAGLGLAGYRRKKAVSVAA